MLSKGFRDEEKEKLSEVFTALLDLEFVPDLWKNEQRKKLDEQLNTLTGLDLNEIANMPEEELLERLKERSFGFVQYEQFGDLLLKIGAMEDEETEKKLAQKALTVYEYSQQESKTFSFGLIQKISQAKSLS